jgi:NAD(P)-dependent dehydrogenase (short-subunit alcohol dehydrogenase family)
LQSRAARGIVGRVTRVILVTGAGRGVGRACALAFAREGARIVCAARTQGEIASVAAECKKAGAVAALAAPVDATNPGSVDELVKRIHKELGTVDVLCHATGGAKTAAFLKTEDALWNEMIGVNLTSAFLVARAVLPDMIAKKKGRVVFIGSTASRSGFRYCAAYAASKHGLLGMVRSLALELGEIDVTVNVIGPGFLDVDATHKAAAEVAARTGRSVDDVLANYRSFSPQKRLVRPEEVSATAIFLASDAARAINGQCLVLDGGAIVS